MWFNSNGYLTSCIQASGSGEHRSLDAVQAKPRAMENMPGWIQAQIDSIPDESSCRLQQNKL